MTELAKMLMMDAVNLSFGSPEAMQKLNEPEEAVIVEFSAHRQRHTVQQRRKWNAKAKAYAMPICGIRPVAIREMNANGDDNLTLLSEKDTNHWRHVDRAYNGSAREKAQRDRHPKTVIDNAINDFEFERYEDFELDESFIFDDGEKLSSLESLSIFEKMKCPEGVDPAEWLLIDELIDNGELYFTPYGGLYIASPESFKFACEHQEAVLALISNNYMSLPMA